MLSEANLAQANLSHTNFNLTTLDSTNFAQAVMYDTILAAIDLCGALNLKSVVHEPPSQLSIGTDTLHTTRQSAGGQFTEEQVAFFTNSGVASEILASTRPIVSSSPVQ